MAAVQLDIPRLAAFADVPADSINELLATPSLDLLTPILSNVAAKAQQYEDFQSSNLRLKVELENVVRTGDAKSRAIRNSLDKSLAENAQLGQRLEAEGRKAGQIHETKLTWSRILEAQLGDRTAYSEILYCYVRLGGQQITSTHH